MLKGYYELLTLAVKLLIDLVFDIALSWIIALSYLFWCIMHLELKLGIWLTGPVGKSQQVSSSACLESQ